MSTLQQIKITLKQSTELELPGHLKKQPVMDLQIDGMDKLLAMSLLSSALAGVIANFKTEVESAQQKFNLKKPD